MMRYYNNLVNKRFGKLIALEPTQERMGGSIKWLCKCDCGKFVKKSARNLTSGGTISCGCSRNVPRPYARGSKKHITKESVVRAIHTRYRNNAKQRNIYFDLSLDDIESLVFLNCIYCGSEPSNTMKLHKQLGFYKYSGIDRLDGTKGYVKENCAPCCKKCNFRKRTDNFDEFREWIKKVYFNLYGGS